MYLISEQSEEPIKSGNQIFTTASGKRNVSSRGASENLYLRLGFWVVGLFITGMQILSNFFIIAIRCCAVIFENIYIRT